VCGTLRTLYLLTHKDKLYRPNILLEQIRVSEVYNVFSSSLLLALKVAGNAPTHGLACRGGLESSISP
jgi:hypothetical protein